MHLPRLTHAVTAAACVAACVATVARAQALRTFHSIDAPNASYTTAQGINARGDIVGWFTDKADKRTRGYLLQDGVFIPIEYPSAAYTDARGINARGDIVGTYRLDGEPAINFHGYVRTKDGDFAPLADPPHTSTITQRITSTGLVVGCRHDDDTMTTMRGVTIDTRDPTQVAEIDAFASMNNGITPDGRLIVGVYYDMDAGKSRAFLLYGDTFVPFDAPGSTLTSAWDVNTRGAVAGIYADASSRVHGFVWERERFTPIDYPLAGVTRAFGLNSRGDVVGAYVDAAKVTHGFVALVDDEER